MSSRNGWSDWTKKPFLSDPLLRQTRLAGDTAYSAPCVLRAIESLEYFDLVRAGNRVLLVHVHILVSWRILEHSVLTFATMVSSIVSCKADGSSAGLECSPLA